jgi:hypothetical protein
MKGQKVPNQISGPFSKTAKILGADKFKCK